MNMLSVRSLAKISMRRTPRKGKDDPISSSPGGKSPLDSALVGAVAGSGNGLLGYARACPAPPPTTDARSNEPKVGFKELSDVTADDLDLGAEASSSNEGFRCPSMGEMYVNCREFMQEAKRQGAGEFLVALAVDTVDSVKVIKKIKRKVRGALTRKGERDMKVAVLLLSPRHLFLDR